MDASDAAAFRISRRLVIHSDGNELCGCACDGNRTVPAVDQVIPYRQQGTMRPASPENIDLNTAGRKPDIGR